MLQVLESQGWPIDAEAVRALAEEQEAPVTSEAALLGFLLSVSPPRFCLVSR